MKIKFLKSAVGPVGNFGKGDVANVDDNDAKSLIEHGIAEPVSEKRSAARKTATAKAKKEKR